MELSLGASAHSQGSRSPRGRAGAWKVMLAASHPLFQDVVFSLFPPLSFTAMSHPATQRDSVCSMFKTNGE